jgi:hypothetical protein
MSSEVVLACGVTGLQGFQSECGLDVAWLVRMRTGGNQPLLILGPMSVTTLLNGTPNDVQVGVQNTMDLCRDNVGLEFFTSNTILPDVPLDNIRAFRKAVLESHW